MPQTSPDTKTKTDQPMTPVEEPRMPDPERHYNPERLCPDQSKDGGWRARP